jgi:hypothetical protein
MEVKQLFDAPTVAVLRRALDDVASDKRVTRRNSVSTLEIAEHILAQAARGERDIERLKASALARFAG